MSRPASLCLLVCVFPAANGCTLVGFGVGAAVDTDRTKLRPTQAWRIATLPSGTPVVLQLADGRRVEGEIEGTRFREPAEYRPIYEAARASGIPLPELGPCTLRDLVGPDHAVELLGLDPQGVVIRAEGGQTRIPFDRLGGLRDARGVGISGPALKRLAERSGVPLVSMVLVRGIGEPMPIERIERVEAPLPRQHDGKLFGTLAGLLVDGLTVAFLYSYMEQGEGPILCAQGVRNLTCGAGR